MDEVIAANDRDLAQARADGITGAMYSRLAINEQKINALATGLRQIADTSFNNVGKIVRRTKISETMNLVQKTVPIGVLMVIFESRPDALPQVASLAIASANGLLMKGGKEATHSNNMLMSIVMEALGAYGCSDSISMVSKREAIADLLKMDEYIDLVFPRVSSELVKAIKEQSMMIPVLGHAEGVCHVYVGNAAAASGHLYPAGTGYGLSRLPHAGSESRSQQQNNRASVSGRSGGQGFGMPAPAATSTLNLRVGRSGRIQAPSRGTNAPVSNQVYMERKNQSCRLP